MRLPRSGSAGSGASSGIDHALVGAVLVRRWGMPSSVALAIERHHSPQAEGHAAAIRLADLVVHYASGEPAPPRR